MYIIGKILVYIYGTGEIALSDNDNEIGGSLLISCAEPTTTNFVLLGFISRAFVTHHSVIFLRSWFTTAIALDESDTGNLKYNRHTRQYDCG